MASYHLRVKIISREKGKSVVAGAAYRSRSKLKLEREGATFDYSNYDGSDNNNTLIGKKGDQSVVAAAAYRSRSNIGKNDFSSKTDLAFSEIMLPKLAPKWMLDRSKLWNHVEEISKRKDARLAREVEIALPRELSLEQNIALVKEYVHENFVADGMVADVNIHNLETNPHAHILLSTRYVTKNGFGATNRLWNRTKNISLWREKWSSAANYHLAKADFDVRIDHRSFEDRGIDLIPQITIRKDNNKDKIDRMNKLQGILIENGNRIINDPTIALKFLTENSATFSHEEMLKFVNGHSHYSQFNEVVTAIENCKELIKVKEGNDDQSGRYSSAQLVGLEKQLESDTIQLSQGCHHRIKEKFIARAMKKCGLSQEQGNALKRAANGDDLSIIIGYAGSGKSYTMRGIKEAYKSVGYSISGVALSGIAVDSLERSSGIKSSTIHRKILQWDKGLEKLTSKSVLIVDEAGTVGTRHMQRIIEEVTKVSQLILMEKMSNISISHGSRQTNAIGSDNNS